MTLRRRTLLGRCYIVVAPHVELANRALGAALQQPLVNATAVEEVQTGHGADFLVVFVLSETD